jgi:urease accessory protein
MVITADTTTDRSGLPLLRLLQLVSPSLPVGAYAYSQGLEQAVERGWIRDAGSLHAWIEGVLEHSFAETDLPLLLQAHDAWSRGDEVDASALARLTLALRETAELRAEERQLGASLARTLSALGVERAQPFVGRDDASFVVLFALGGCHFGVTAPDLAQGHAFAWAENQVIGATRLISLGQSDAQRVLLRVAEAIPAALGRAALVSREQVGRSAIGLCLASAWHEGQYSRLFRS